MVTRRKFTPEYKARIVLEMLTEQKSAAQGELIIILLRRQNLIPFRNEGRGYLF